MNVGSSKEDFLKAELEFANARNSRLSQENALLRQKLQNLTSEERSNSTLHIEAKLKAFKLEEERDRIYEKYEKIKKKYNQLHDAFIQKVKRCKVLEDVFNRQKTLNGLVMKSAIDQKQKEQQDALDAKYFKQEETRTIETLEAQLAKLQTALDEAYDIIDELEFELESVDFLEVENQRLRNELETYKIEKCKLRRATNSSYPEECKHMDIRETDVTSYNELAECRPTNDLSLRFDSNVSSLADSLVGDLDPVTMEKLVLTESLTKTIETESNCLRRELLRSRLQQASRPTVRPTSSDA